MEWQNLNCGRRNTSKCHVGAEVGSKQFTEIPQCFCHGHTHANEPACESEKASVAC
jgi:hypothetical protein